MKYYYWIAGRHDDRQKIISGRASIINEFIKSAIGPYWTREEAEDMLKRWSK